MVGFYGGAPLESAGLNEQGSDAVPSSTSEVHGAVFGEALAQNIPARLFRSIGRSGAETGLLGVGELGTEIRMEPEAPMAPEAANAEFGIKGHLSFDKPVPHSVAQDLNEHKQTQIEREDTINRRESGILTGGAARFVTGMLPGLLDPVNLTAGFIPFVGEARVASMLGRGAVEAMGAAERAGVRAVTGAGQGAAAMTALQPLEFALSRQEHEDYTMAMALRSIALGTAIGGGLHAGIGGAIDRATGRYRNPLTQRLEEAGPEARETLLQGALAQSIEGRPVDVAPALDLAEAIKAYHGTPHTFEPEAGAPLGRFRTDKIDTGEGAQAFGHGIYLAEQPETARVYREKLAPRTPLESAADKAIIEHGSREVAAADAEALASRLESRGNGDPENLRFARDLADFLKSDKPLPGNVYEARIKADADHFLDWDKPLDEQSASVRDALLNNPDPGIAGLAAKWGHDIPALYTRLAQRAGQGLFGDKAEFFPEARSPELASRILSEMGIPGIRYLDAGSRGRGDGTRNYVVFDPKHVEIVARNGERAPDFREAAAATIEAARRQPEANTVAARDAAEVQARAPEPAAAVDAQVAEAQRALDTVMKELQPETTEPRPGGEARPASETVAEHPELREADEMVARAEGDALAYEKAATCLAERGL